ncbi:unnamed protein product [Meloidogyne enterolobii]|uniref:Uncharacterized protein n=1 Tax=Meloidogyne enterolobii TaxID=390850 RepID=A0ACB1A5N7_MELEN
MMFSSSSKTLGILFLYSSLIVIILGCGLPPAPAPPPAPCCAPPAPPPPPPCCPCPPPAPMQSCCPCAAAPPPSSHCGGCMFGARRRMYSSASLRKYWRSKREIDVMKVNEATAQKLQYINVTEVPCPRAEWYSPIRKVLLKQNRDLRNGVRKKTLKISEYSVETIKKAYYNKINQNSTQHKTPKIF